MSSHPLVLFPELVIGPPDSYTTGLLPSQRLQEMIEAGYIRASVPIAPEQIQPASLDLRLGPVAYRVRASFLPTARSTVQKKLQEVKICEVDLTEPALLERGGVYLIPLQEELSLPDDVSGKVNPKSSTGRLDIFTRVIGDYGTAFEEIRPGYRGKLYAEVVPLTFQVFLREGARLNQLRLRKGNPTPAATILWRSHEEEPIVYAQDGSPLEPLIEQRGRLGLSVDLQGIDGADIIGYRAKRGAPPVDFQKINHYDPKEFWEPLYRSSHKSVVLEPEEFYILTSKEKVVVPPHLAAEMLPFDPSAGEFRIHYAGFFDPGFGWSADESTKGSHAVLEVRSHGVPSLLEDGQVVTRLIYEQLLAAPGKLYGQGIGSSYQSQQLALSKHFRRG
jgi:dCTP deaminase